MKWIRTALCALGMLACLSLSAFAAELGEPNITEQTTMKELRENPSIKGSGFYTYCNEWIEGSTKYDNTPIKGYVSWAASEDAAEGMNLVIENYNKGVQVTWQVYTPEEIEADPALGMVQLFYFMASIQHPVAGDPVYGPHNCITSLHGQCLHAKTLGFIHPITGEQLRFDSELPEYFTHFLATLRRETL